MIMKKSPLSDVSTHSIYTLEDACFKIGNSYNKPLVVATIGSQHYKEKDLFVLEPVDRLTLDVTNINKHALSFKSILGSIKPHRSVFLFDLHKSLATNNSTPALHLLFYPSLQFLELWELPSFIAEVCSGGSFVYGDNQCLLALQEQYLKRSTVSIPCTNLHLGRYSNIAVYYYLYSLLEPVQGISSLEIFNKIAYAFRFTLIEYLNITSPIIERRTPHSWEALFRQQDLLPMYLRNALRLIQSARTNDSIISEESIQAIFESYCQLHNDCLHEH